MRFANLASALLLSFLPFAPTVFAQTSGKNAITYPNVGSEVDTSKPFIITWNPDTKGTVTIELLKGPQKNLNNLGPIAASIKNTGSFTWKVPNSLEDMGTMGSDIYGFKIIDDLTNKFEYSPPFHMSIPDSTYVDPSKDKDDEKEDEDKKTTSTAASSTKTTTSTPSTTSTTKSTTSTTSTKERTTSTTSTTSSSTTSKPTTTNTSTSSTTTEETPTPTPESIDDTTLQESTAPTETIQPTAAPVKEKKKDKGKPLGIPIIAWVGIGIGGLFAALILTYCVSLAVRNHKLRKEERERSLMPNPDIKPTQAVGPYKQIDDDLEKAVLAETKGTVPYGAATFVTNQRNTTTSVNYSNNAGFVGPDHRGDNIEMAEYGNNGGYYEEPAYNQNYNNPQQGGQHAFQDGYQQQQQPFRGPQQGYPTADSNGAFSEHYSNYPPQQQQYNAGRSLPGNGNPSYRY